MLYPFLLNAVENREWNNYDIIVDGICYSLNKTENKATVEGNFTFREYSGIIKNSTYTGDIIIPEEILYEGTMYKVTSIASRKHHSHGIHEPWGDVPSAFEGSEITSITIPQTIPTLGSYWFYGCKKLRSVDFKGDINIIGYSTFEGCESLEFFHVPNGVTKIEYRAFRGCVGLKGVNIKDLNLWCGVDIGNEEDSPLHYAKHLYLNGELINNLVLPEDVSKVNHLVFYNCIDIESLSIGKNVDFIGYKAFAGCTSLGNIYCYTENYPKTFATNAFDENTYNSAILHVYDYAIESFKSHEKFKNIVVFEKVTDFTLNYYIDDVLYKSYKHKYEDEITPEPSVEKEGYTFVKWDGEPTVMPGKDVNVNAVFSINKYKLNYIVDEETYKSYEVEYGSSITAEAEPTKENFEFSGWSEIPETMPAKDVDITGSFKRIALTIDDVTYTFDEDNAIVTKDKGKNGDVVIASTVESDGKTYSVVGIADNVFKDNTDITAVTIPDSMTSIGEYAFSGCKNIKTISIGSGIKNIGTRAFANIDKLTDVTVSAADVPETDRTAFESSYLDYVTLYVPYGLMEKYKSTGPWSGFKSVVAIEGTQRTFKVTYKIDDEEYKTIEVKEGEAIPTMADPTKEGYTFSGWSDIPDVMPSQDVTVTGTFTINKYKLVYIVDGEEYKTVEVEYGSVITPEENPTKEGYIFSGWSSIPETMPANDVTVTGSFSKGAYTLTYIVDGETYKTYSYDYGAAVTPEAYPEKEGYTFSGWDNVPESMPAGNVTVTGSFTVNKYTITYYVDGEVYKTVEVEYGAKITAEEEPTKEGYDFSGWSWIPSKMPAEDVKVTGSFTKANYEVDGATYQIDEDGATLTKDDDATGDVVLDATVTINGKTYKITVIGEGAFQGNEQITSLTVPDGIETIMSNAFDGCSSLLKVLLGKGVKKIGSKAFGNIWKAATTRTRTVGDGFRVECNAESVPEIEADAFEGTEIEKATLVVQDELVNSYKTAEVWKNFGSIIGFTEATGVDGIFVDNPSAVIYSIDGRRLDKAQKGMNVIWTEKGVKKVIVR